MRVRNPVTYRFNIQKNTDTCILISLVSWYVMTLVYFIERIEWDMNSIPSPGVYSEEGDFTVEYPGISIQDGGIQDGGMQEEEEDEDDSEADVTVNFAVTVRDDEDEEENNAVVSQNTSP